MQRAANKADPYVDTCICGTIPVGFKKLDDRNMWVCNKCSKPANTHYGQFSYSASRMCEECLNDYTADKLPDRFFLCPDCRG